MKIFLSLIFPIALFPVLNAQDCGNSTIHCVDVYPGATQEYTSIQAAVNAASAGDSVLVFAGSYEGFRVNTSGTSTAQLVIKAYEPNVIINASEKKSGNEHIYIANSNYVTIEGFEVVGADRHGIGSHDATATDPMIGLEIKNNKVSRSGNVNIYLSQASHSLVEGNESFDSKSHGMYMSNAGTDNTVIRNNIIHNNDIAGIHFNGDLSVGGDGIISGLLVDGNQVYENGQNGLNMDGVRETTIQNNLIYNNNAHAIRVYAIDGAAGPKDMRIINNSMYNNGSWAIKLTADEGGHVIFNNILLSKKGSIVVDNENIQCDHNIVQNKFSLNGEDKILDFSAWKNSGFGLNSALETATEVYTDPSNVNFELNSLSVALNNIGINSLANISAPNKDIHGNNRPQGGKIDAGAIEKQDENVSINSANLKDKEFYISPNPSTGILHLNKIKEGLITIFDVQGNLVYQQQLNQTQINLSNLNKGIYVVKIISTDIVYQTRLVLR